MSSVLGVLLRHGDFGNGIAGMSKPENGNLEEEMMTIVGLRGHVVRGETGDRQPLAQGASHLATQSLPRASSPDYLAVGIDV